MMRWLQIVVVPLTALRDNIDASITAQSIANAREGAVDTSLRTLAYSALRRVEKEGSLSYESA